MLNNLKYQLLRARRYDAEPIIYEEYPHELSALFV